MTSKTTTRREKSVNKPDASGWYEIHHAAGHGDVTRLKRLVEKDNGATLNLVTKNNRACTPLILTAEYNHTDAMALLLDCKANIDKPDSWGCTALMSAILDEHPAAVRMLLARGANRELRITSGEETGLTALAFARFKGDNKDNLEILTMLEAKPPPEAPPAPFPAFPLCFASQVSNLAK